MRKKYSWCVAEIRDKRHPRVVSVDSASLNMRNYLEFNGVMSHSRNLPQINCVSLKH